MSSTKREDTSPSSRHHVRAALQEMILSGGQPAGSQLKQQKLARKLEVAQSVIRESLLELKALGLVQVVDNLGAFVSTISVRELLEAYDVREMLEALAVRLCCDAANRTQIRRLLEFADEIYALGRAGKHDEMASTDRELHVELVHICNSRTLARLFEGCVLLGKVFRVNRPLKAVYDEHQAIIATIEAGNRELAEQLTRQHIRAARQTLESLVGRGEDSSTLVFRGQPLVAGTRSTGMTSTPRSTLRVQSDFFV